MTALIRRTTGQLWGRYLAILVAAMAAISLVVWSGIARATITVSSIAGTTTADLVAGTANAEYDFSFSSDVSDATSEHITIVFPENYVIAASATVQDAAANGGAISIGGADNQPVTVTTDPGTRQVRLQLGTAQDLAADAVVFRVVTGVTNPQAAGTTGQFTIRIGNTAGGAGSAGVDENTSAGTVTITPDAIAGVVTVALDTNTADNNPVTGNATATVTAGSAFAVRVTVVDQFDNVVDFDSASAGLAFTTTATASPDATTPTVTGNSGNLTFANGIAEVAGFTLVNAGETPSITATGNTAGADDQLDGLADATPTLTVNASAANVLVFATQPVDTIAGGNLLPVIEIHDAFDNVVTDDDRSITLSIQDDPLGGTTLNGTTVVASSNGVATWAPAQTLNITAVADGYTLLATADGAAFATSSTVVSAPFNIQVGPQIFGVELSHDADGDSSWDAVDDVITVFWSDAATHASGDGLLTEVEVEAALGPDITYAVGPSTVALTGSGSPVWTLTIGAADLTAGIDVGTATLGTDNADVTDTDGNPQVPGSLVTLQSGSWPECGTVIGGVTVNSRCIMADGFQISTDGGSTWVSTSPTDGDGLPADPSDLDLEVFDTGLLQIQVVDDARLGQTPDQYELIAGGGQLAAGDQIRMELNIGSMDPVVLIGTGALLDYTTTTGGDTIVEIVAEPGNASWLNSEACNLADFGGCGDHTTAADVDYTGFLTFAIDELDFDADFQAAARGTTIMTDAQTFAAPAWDPVTESFVIDVAAPHFLTDGTTVNTGEFAAFLPDGLFTSDFFGVSPSAAVFTASANGSSITASATVVTGGVELVLSGFSYSAPEIAIKASAAPPSGGPSPTPTPTPTPPPGAETTSGGVDRGGTLSTDPEGTGATQEKPIQAAVTTPNSGVVSITTQPATGTQSGFQLVGTELDISAPDATPEEPLTLSLRVDSSAVGAGKFVGVFRNGVLVPPCATPNATTASPDPCVASTSASGDDVVLTVLTSKASVWNLGALELGTIGVVCPAETTPSAGFTDVAGDHAHGAAIDCIVANGITSGTSADSYSPSRDVTRDQMATFLVNVLDAAGVTLADGSSAFTDIEGNPHADNIERLVAAGIASGRTATTYDPHGVVNREQMATFLVAAFEHVTGRTVAEADTAFTDVSGTHAANVRRLVELGVTLGVTDTEYAPLSDVRRGQMASFLGRTLNRLAVEGFSKS